MTLPGTNVTLLDVRAPGTRKPNGDPGAPGAALWSGSAPAYLSRADEAKTERGRSHTVEGRDVIVHVTKLTAFLSDGAPSTEIAGPDWTASTVLISDLAGNNTRYTVIGYEHKGQGTVADKVDLTLDYPVAA